MSHLCFDSSFKCSFSLLSFYVLSYTGQLHGSAHLIMVFTVNVLNFFKTLFFMFSNKILAIRAGIHKILVRISNRQYPDQTASSEAV